MISRSFRSCHRRAYVLLGMACVSLFGHAATLPAANETMTADVPLRADALIAEALQNHPQLTARQRATESAQARARRAGALPDPVLNYAIAPASLGVADLDPGHIVGLAQPLPWPGKRAAQRAQAEHGAAAVAAMQTLAAREVVLAARTIFAEWVFVHRALQINTAQRAVLTELMASARGQYVAGEGGQHALLSAELRLRQREKDALAWQARCRSVQARINALRDQPPRAPVAAPDLSPPSVALVANIEPAAALATHPEIVALDARIRAATVTERLADLDRRPDLRLTATWLGTLPRDENRGQVGIALNLPFGQDQRRDAAAAARGEHEALQAQRRERLNDLLATLEDARAAATAAAETVTLYREQMLPLAEQSLAAARAAYASGAGSFRDLIDAENDLLESRLGLAGAQRDHIQQHARITALTRDEGESWMETNQ